MWADVVELAVDLSTFRMWMSCVLPPQTSSVGILTVKNRTLSPLAERFLDCARAVATPLVSPRKAAGRTA